MNRKLYQSNRVKYKIRRPKNKIRVFKKTKYWYCQIVHVNGNILMTSEIYSSKTKARQTAKNLFNSFKKGYAIYEEL